MAKIAIVAKHSWIGVSTSLINTVLFWDGKGFQVDIFIHDPDPSFPLPNFASDRVRYYVSQSRFRWPLDDLAFSFSSTPAGDWDFVIAFDAPALMRVALAPRFARARRWIYHSLEFYEPPRSSVKGKIRKSFERVASRRCHYVFTQGKLRANHLARDLGVAADRIKVIFNSPYCGRDETLEQDRYFHQKFFLQVDQTVVLAIGSMIREHCIVELVKSVPDWPTGFVLVLHGWFPSAELRAWVVGMAAQISNRIFLSEELFSNEQRLVPYRSCDIGFVGFSGASENYRLASEAAGKLFDFLCAGTPIVAFDGPGMRDLVEGNGAGKVFLDFQEMAGALQFARSNAKNLADGAKTASVKYDFQTQYNTVFQEIVVPAK